MSSLKTRVARNGRQAPPLAPVEGGRVVGANAPAARIQIVPGVGAGLGPLSPIYTSDGAAIPATGPGQWDQLYAAGRT